MAHLRIVAVLGQGVVPPDTPVLTATDPAVVGDGLIETMHVRDGRPWLADEHLDRLLGAARAIGLTTPPRAELAALLAEVCAPWPPGREGALRLVCTSGPPERDAPTAFATLSEVDPQVRRTRRSGISVATLPLGIAATARADAPWLLGGVKSSSRAVHIAAQRWAATRGVDDVLWTSTDGYALEGPTANLVWLDGDVLCTVPAATTGVLPGVTAAWLLAHAGDLGWRTAERMVTPDQLRRAAGVWFTSSVRGAAEVRVLDGAPLPASPHTRAIQDLMGYPVTGDS
jgi:4-amino-4-deoxychorismate lyase